MLFRFLLILFFACWTGFSSAQIRRLAAVCSPGKTLYVSVYAGLSLRDTPSLSGKVLTVVKFGEPVVVLADDQKPIPVTNSGITGQWVKVKYGNFSGYQFDGFLSRYKPMSEFNDIRGYGEFLAYLGTTFTVLKHAESPPDTTQGAKYWEWSKFEKGVRYSRSGQEYAYTKVAFPATLITFQEVYFMVRNAYPTVFYGKEKPCNYVEGNTQCEFLTWPLKITQVQDSIFIEEGPPGY